MADPQTKVALTLEVYKGDVLLQTKAFTRESVPIGSGPDAALTIDDASVAALHAVLNVGANGAVKLLDLGGGVTRVDGERLSNTAVAHGDAFQLGDVRLVVRIPTDAPPVDAFDDEEVTNVAAVPELGAPMRAEPMSKNEQSGFDDEPPTDPGVDATDPGASASSDDADDDEQGQVEDVMDFIMRAGTAKSNLGIDTRRPKVLEVMQAWQQTLLDSKHFAREGKPVSIGSSVGWKWNLLGIDLGWVFPPLHILLRYTPPMWSDVTSEWKNDFYVSDASLPNTKDHDLFHWAGDHYEAEIASGWDGFVDLPDKRYTFDELVSAGKAKKTKAGYSVPFDDTTRLMVDIDGMLFFAHMTPPGKKIIARPGENVDYPFLAIMGLVGFIGLMFGVLMWTLPPPPKNDMVEIPDRFVELILEKPEQEQKKSKPSGNPDAGEGAKAKKEEGKVGKKDAKMEKAKGNKVEVKKQEIDRQIVESSGVLGALNDNASAMDGVFGSSGLNSDITGGIGGLIGAKGTQIGSGGLGSRGSGLGGGGTAEGLGGLGTKGHGSGSSGYGSGGGNFGAKGDGAIGTVGGDPIILGALDRSLIDEVVKRHMNQIRYCYQRELTKDPSLGGKVVIKFVIAKDGSVSSASTKTTTMSNAAVESCIEGRFMRMQFPTPKGGGIVIVSYPFLFSPG